MKFDCLRTFTIFSSSAAEERSFIREGRCSARTVKWPTTWLILIDGWQLLPLRLLLLLWKPLSDCCSGSRCATNDITCTKCFVDWPTCSGEMGKFFYKWSWFSRSVNQLTSFNRLTKITFPCLYFINMAPVIQQLRRHQLRRRQSTSPPTPCGRLNPVGGKRNIFKKKYAYIC